MLEEQSTDGIALIVGTDVFQGQNKIQATWLQVEVFACVSHCPCYCTLSTEPTSKVICVFFYSFQGLHILIVLM